MPMIQKLYDDYKDKIVFLFLTSDDQSKVEKFYIDHSYEFPTYNLLSNPPQQIDTKSIPATFILDKQGKVAISEFGAEDWNSNKVRKLLDELLLQ